MKAILSGKKIWRLPAAVLGLMLCSIGAFAQGGKIDTGDTAWVLASSALVLLMTPGLGLFYGGMVRRKNVLATIMQSFIMCGVVGILWVLYGYSNAFGTDHWGLFGSLEWVGLKGVGVDPAKPHSPRSTARRSRRKRT